LHDRNVHINRREDGMECWSFVIIICEHLNA